MSNASTQQAADRIARHAAPEYFDVLIVGAGISGIGAAHHLREQCPERSFVIVESKETFGGTWHTHTYPGIRSDSDLYTFGYRFKPWSGKPLAEADAILGYMGEVIQEDGLAEHIRYGHRVRSASWDSDEQRWNLVIERAADNSEVRTAAGFLWMCQGYYDHAKGYTPQWPGMEDFGGTIVHPQTWPEDLDYKGKRVVVIGSGATAATLIPNMADDCEHVTMLQRSPTYFWTGENRNEMADTLRALEVPEEWVHEIVRRKLLADYREIQNMSAEYPDLVKAELLSVVRQNLGEDFDVDKHFTPSYRPWQQRVAYVPDGDLFKGIKSGKVSIVTDHIERFTEKGILLKSGEELEADIVVTATGFNLCVLGKIAFDIDGEPVDFAERYTWRGLMLSDIPNMVYVFGYLRTSWTMRVDLVGDFVCRLLNHMRDAGTAVVTPVLAEDERDMPRQPWVLPEDFNPGYMQRGVDKMPRQGDREPWLFQADYYIERETMPAIDLGESSLEYRTPKRRPTESAA